MADEYYLYRYRSLDSNDSKNLDAFLADRLYFSTPNNFNDPYDCLLYYNREELEKGIISSIKRTTESYVMRNLNHPIFAHPINQYIAINYGKSEDRIKEHFHLIESEFPKLKEMMRNNFKTICFSFDNESELMWAHYASKRKGFVLGYNIMDLINAQCFRNNGKQWNRKQNLLVVQYSDDRYDLGTYLFNRVANNLTYNSGVDLPVNIKANRDELGQALCTKSLAWSYEQECRLLPGMIDPIRDNDIEYIQVKPKEVIIGNEMDENYQKRFIEKCRNDGISVSKIMIDELSKTNKIKVMKMK